MFNRTKTTSAILVSSLLLAQGFGALKATAASPPAFRRAIVSEASVIPAQHRPRYYGHSYDRHRGVNPGVIIGGIIIGAIIAEAIREGRARDSDMERCAARFRSFDPRSGTYVTYSGEVRVCPYLR